MAQDTSPTLVCHLDDIPEKGARRVPTAAFEVALFRTSDGSVFALRNECPHKKGPLSEGIVHGHSVTCPLHNWVIDLKTGQAMGADEGCTHALKVTVGEDGKVYVALPALEGAAA
ncbi:MULTISPECIES: nitrite reductase small subunit NirD [Kordiimonas]|jgi:nitrite reductase (NADH) small subunit|uniref:Nitrite reductase (NADH) small subunit n=1 Tax=Kordiimonas lacus TaxID=637679 RepID=A0A1G6YQE6_9PROT|nr:MULTISPECIES: nitrite reductase small subunit NirD [Kordiimonas]SDD92253.1 nitrite reductase (NADH) small subunit [Kordiimonas lacus]